MDGGAWWAAVHGVAKSGAWLNHFPFTFHFHALEKEMATHSSVLAWRIPGTGEPGGLPSMGSHRVGHNWSDLAAAAAAAVCKSWLMKGRKAYGTCENPTPARTSCICVCMCVTVQYHNMLFNVKQIGVPIHGESDVLWITLRLYKSKLFSLIGKDFYNLFSPHFRVLPFPSA